MTITNYTGFIFSLNCYSSSGSHVGSAEVNTYDSISYTPPSSTSYILITTNTDDINVQWTSSSSGSSYVLYYDNQILPTGSRWPNITLNTSSYCYNCDCDCDCNYCDCDCDCDTSYWSLGTNRGTLTNSGSISLNPTISEIEYFIFTAPSKGTITVYSNFSQDMYGWIFNNNTTIYPSYGSGSSAVQNSNYISRDDDSYGNSQFLMSDVPVESGQSYKILVHAYSPTTDPSSGTVYLTFTPSITSWQTPTLITTISPSANYESTSPYSYNSSINKYAAGYIQYYVPAYPGKIVFETTTGSTSPDYYSYLSTTKLSANSGTSRGSAVTGSILYQNDDGADTGYDTRITYVHNSSTRTYYYIYVNAAWADSGTYTFPWKLWYYKQYTITYNLNDTNATGSVSAQNFYANNTTVTISSTVPTRSGYTFRGWSTSSTATSPTYTSNTSYTLSAQNYTLYAVWTKNPTLTINYCHTDGTLIEQKTETKTYNTSVNPTSYNKTISGYTYSSCNPSASFYITSNQTLYIYYTGNTYSITYNVNGGAGSISSTSYTMHPTNTTVSLTTNKPTFKNKLFKRWNTKADGTGTDYKSGQTITKQIGGITLYAKWVNGFYWSEDDSINPQQNQYINTYINTNKMNELINLINQNKNQSISQVNSTTKISLNLYNTLAALFSIVSLTTDTKITAAQWIALQNAYNNFIVQ